MTCSNPTRVGLAFPEPLLLALERAQRDSLVYRPEPLGELSARVAVARHFDARPASAGGADARDVLLTASSSEAYSYLFKLLCDPGDAVLVPAPSYPLFEHLLELEGVQAIPYRLSYDGAWHVDVDSVRGSLTARVRAIVVVSPNNPTGQYLRAAEQAALQELGLPLVIDEVFFEYPLTAAAERAAAEPPPEPLGLVFRLGGASKLFGLPQLKLSWTLLAGPPALRRSARERLELIADTFLSVATPIQRALPALFETLPARSGAILERCRRNLSLLEAAVTASPVSVLRPEAGWCAVLRLPAVQSEEELVLGLLDEQGVLVQPGWFYDFETEAYAIVSLLCEPSDFEPGIAKLVGHMTTLTG